jgi:hypothetical protein
MVDHHGQLMRIGMEQMDYHMFMQITTMQAFGQILLNSISEPMVEFIKLQMVDLPGQH